MFTSLIRHFLFIFLSAANVRSSIEQGVSFGDKNATTYQATVGEPFTVRITACVACGYLWSAENQTVAIKITGPRYEDAPPEAASSDGTDVMLTAQATEKAKSGGEKIAVFEMLAIEPLHSTIHFVYKRPWDPEIEKTAVLHLTVAAASRIASTTNASTASAVNVSTNIPAQPAATNSLRGALVAENNLLPSGLLNRGWFPQGCNGLLCNGNCPITANPTTDGGCCGGGSIGAGSKSCVVISPSNLLRYSCGLPTDEASQVPVCKNRSKWWQFWSNKAVNEKCQLGGESCTYIRYGWFTRKINLFGGNRQDKLTCTCPSVPVYRRADEDSPWTLGA